MFISISNLASKPHRCMRTSYKQLLRIKRLIMYCDMSCCTKEEILFFLNNCIVLKGPLATKTKTVFGGLYEL